MTQMVPYQLVLCTVSVVLVSLLSVTITAIVIKPSMPVCWLRKGEVYTMPLQTSLLQCVKKSNYPAENVKLQLNPAHDTSCKVTMTAYELLVVCRHYSISAEYLSHSD